MARPKKYTIERVKANFYYPKKLFDAVTEQAEQVGLTFTDLFAVGMQELLERMITLPNVYSAENLNLKLLQIYNGDKF